MLEETLRENFQLKAIFENNNKTKCPFKDVPIYYGWNSFLEWSSKNDISKYSFMVAIGGSNGNDRLEIHDKLKNHGIQPISAIHESSYVSFDACYDEGLQVLPNATINPRVSIGKCCIINTSASIDHECNLGDGVHIGPGAKLAGCISVGDFSFIGTNATILPSIKIGKNVTVGAGSVVTRDIEDNTIGYGNPFKKINYE